ncbi:hypothetical protein ABFV80_001800 [Vandammella animalimorsus]|uniref:hypothetical protein n=1 Tax=Vandammella animalimorsus TaxID=2029117 RepID=UPI00325A912B
MTAVSSPRLRLALRRAALGAVLAASGTCAVAQQVQAADAGAPVVYERVVSGGVGSSAGAAPEAASAAAPTAGARTPAVRISHQDAGSRVDELRVRGQTQEITVTPAGQLPTYEVQPGSSQRYQSHQMGRHASDGTNGPRRWKLGEF